MLYQQYKLNNYVEGTLCTHKFNTQGVPTLSNQLFKPLAWCSRIRHQNPRESLTPSGSIRQRLPQRQLQAQHKPCGAFSMIECTCYGCTTQRHACVKDLTPQSPFRYKPQLFRLFVTSQYYANRDEYHSAGQQQPYTFEQYTSNNMQQLRRDFKLHKQRLTQTLAERTAALVGGGRWSQCAVCTMVAAKSLISLEKIRSKPVRFQ